MISLKGCNSYMGKVPVIEPGNMLAEPLNYKIIFEVHFIKFFWYNAPLITLKKFPETQKSPPPMYSAISFSAAILSGDIW